jgi:sugar phosphate isomerase/epimerase
VKIGISTWSLLTLPLVEAVKMIGDAGADVIELWCDPPHYDVENTLPDDVEQLQDLLTPYQMSVSAHAPVNDVNICTRYNDLNQGIQRTIVKLAGELEKYKTKRVTFHPGHVYWRGHVEDSDFVSMAFYRSMARLGSMKVNVENQAPTGHPFKYNVASNFESLDHILTDVPEVDFTLDTGHAGLAGLDPKMLFDRYGGRVTEVHLHNNDGKLDSHDIITKGSLDLVPLVDSAKGRNVTVILELNPYTYTPEQVMAEFRKLEEFAAVTG